MYIYRAGVFLQEATAPRTALKDRLRQAGCGPLRRAGRFNQLAVLGAKLCCAGLTLPRDCDIVLSSVNGSLSDTAAVLHDLLTNRQMPMPFDFINTQNNSACFYVASELGISGSSLFCSHHACPLETALTLAMSRWSGSEHGAALVGCVEEWSGSRFIHPAGYGSPQDLRHREGACCLLLANAYPGLAPLARVSDLRVSIPQARVAQLLQHHGLYENDVVWDVDEVSEGLLPAQARRLAMVHGDTSALERAAALAGWVTAGEGVRLCRVHQAGNRRFRVMLVERCAQTRVAASLP